MATNFDQLAEPIRSDLGMSHFHGAEYVAGVRTARTRNMSCDC